MDFHLSVSLHVNFTSMEKQFTTNSLTSGVILVKIP